MSDQKNKTPSLRTTWLQDLRRSAFPLLGVTIFAIVANGFIAASALLLVPELRSILDARSLSATLNSFIGISERSALVFGLLALFLLVNACFIGWMVVIVARRTLQADALASGRVRFQRFLAWIGTGILGILILASILIIGGAVAYGVSRWYIGAVLPILLVAVSCTVIFGLWFLFLPIVVIREGLRGPRALSESRFRAKHVSGRLLLLAIAFLLVIASTMFELDGFAPWMRGAILGLILPIGTSLLASLYRKTEPASTSD